MNLPCVVYHDTAHRIVVRLNKDDQTLEVVAELNQVDALGDPRWVTMLSDRNPRTAVLEKAVLRLAGLNPNFKGGAL